MQKTKNILETINWFEKIINSTSLQFKVNTMSVQQQSNTIDCGIFAKAFAIDLLLGNLLSNVSYEHGNTCLFVYNEVRSHYFQEQVQKLARLEVLRTI